jgi:hypothetical protein
VLALRQQVRVLERQVKRVRWQPIDRLILSLLRERLPRSAWAGLFGATGDGPFLLVSWWPYDHLHQLVERLDFQSLIWGIAALEYFFHGGMNCIPLTMRKGLGSTMFIAKIPQHRQVVTDHAGERTSADVPQFSSFRQLHQSLQ